ncbi:hypothetical protein GIB67_031319, partial [Kingdonia uniflora]
PQIPNFNQKLQPSLHNTLQIKAIDAAQPYDLESNLNIASSNPQSSKSASLGSRLKRNTLFVDVLSVKEFPRNLFFRILPKDFDVLCTHPMFGPESGRNGWKGLPFVYDKVRIGRDESRVNRCERFLNIFVQEDCRMEEMSCKEHDKNAAESQFITHTVGRLEILDMAFEALKKELFEHENKDFGVTKEKPMLPLLLENGKSPTTNS